MSQNLEGLNLEGLLEKALSEISKEFLAMVFGEDRGREDIKIKIRIGEDYVEKVIISYSEGVGVVSRQSKHGFIMGATVIPLDDFELKAKIKYDDQEDKYRLQLTIKGKYREYFWTYGDTTSRTITSRTGTYERKYIIFPLSELRDS